MLGQEAMGEVVEVGWENKALKVRTDRPYVLRQPNQAYGSSSVSQYK